MGELIRIYLFIIFSCITVGASHAALILTDDINGIEGAVLICVDQPPILSNPELFAGGTVLDWGAGLFVPALDLNLLNLTLPYNDFSFFGDPFDIETLLGGDQTVYVFFPEDIDYPAVPEPASGLLLAAGLCLMGRRKKTSLPVH